MTQQKIDLLLVFGGQSEEHAISLRSAQAVLNNLSEDRYTVSLLYIHRNGAWSILPKGEIDEQSLGALAPRAPLPWGKHKGHKAFPFGELAPDIVFPILHGPNGEDGRLQGFLQMMGIPLVGCSAPGSLLSMDKGLSKAISREAGLKVARHRVFQKGDSGIIEQIFATLPFPLFVKPCNLGSSVGISRVDNTRDLPKALELAFSLDRRIIVEEGLPVREIELSVMGRSPNIWVSQPGELIPHNLFYDYNDKYIEGKTQFALPADLTQTQRDEAREMARKAYSLHQLDGFARVDLFLHKESGNFYFNEINTIPGFTEISMFPKLWQLEGITFPDLIDRLVDIGLSKSEP